jgi:hypothetical protein
MQDCEAKVTKLTVQQTSLVSSYIVLLTTGIKLHQYKRKSADLHPMVVSMNGEIVSGKERKNPAEEKNVPTLSLFVWLVIYWTYFFYPLTGTLLYLRILYNYPGLNLGKNTEKWNNPW